MKKWETLNKFTSNNLQLTIKDVIRILLENRGVKTKREVEEFLNPKIENVKASSVGINKKNLKKAVSRIQKAIKSKEEVVIFGDYDVDGICATAILWETLNALGAKVTPYIPHRISEGYGLSKTGIKNLKFKIKNCSLIITVDNGIVANKAVDFARKLGIDVVITDHHVPSKIQPNAHAIVHTTRLCGAGVAWMLSNVILNSVQDLKIPKQVRDDTIKNHLELVALATIADMVPLKEANRIFLFFGLLQLQKTKRIGLLELFKEAGIDSSKIGVYEIGHIIAPRLNATGRLDYAMDSLRLLCTKDKNRAGMLAAKLGRINRERQLLTIETTRHAVELVKKKKELRKILFIVHESYQQGVIGLVAGKLAEEFYRPAIVVSKGKIYSKASARSIKGFNIIEFIREAKEFLVDAGGHPMAAGFTVETQKISALEKIFNKKMKNLLNEEILTRKLRIDCELPLSFINYNLYDAIQKLTPFGMGNPEPTFVSRDVMVENLRLVGNAGKHIKFRFKIYGARFTIDGIGFEMGEMSSKIHIGDKVDIVYTIDENEWPARRSFSEGGNGEKRLQLKIKDLVKL